jgi:hypothetical protein
LRPDCDCPGSASDDEDHEVDCEVPVWDGEAMTEAFNMLEDMCGSLPPNARTTAFLLDRVAACDSLEAYDALLTTHARFLTDAQWQELRADYEVNFDRDCRIRVARTHEEAVAAF